MLNGSCHCGAVQIAVAEKPQSLTQCTCSICHRYGAQWAYCTRSTATVSCDPDAVSVYVWGDKSIEFYFCNTCGCLTHYESVEKFDDSRIAVNARMLTPIDTGDIRIRTFDGADTWKYLDGRKSRKL